MSPLISSTRTSTSTSTSTSTDVRGTGEAPLRPVVPGRGLLGPRRPRHRVDLSTGTAALPVGDDGVLIGVDVADEPALLGLFRDSAMDIVLVGGLWLVQVIALRAAAVGARVVVETARPHLWSALAQAAGAEQPCVTVHGVGQIGAQGASVSGPILVVRDAGSRPGRSRLAATPWQTTLTLLPYLVPRADRLLASADLVAVQRISPQESEAVGRTLGLPSADMSSLSTLGDQVSVWATKGHLRYVMTHPTATENHLLGPARRVD